MQKILVVSAIALAFAAPAQARNIDSTTQSPGSTCSGLHLTAYPGNVLDPEPLGCCNERRNCPRYLSIKPVPQPHRDLKT